MIVGICKLTLYLPACHSLKEKRQVLRRIKDRTANSFGINVSEVGANDMWQRAELGFAAVGNDRRIIEGLIQKTINFINEQHLAEILDEHKEIINA